MLVWVTFHILPSVSIVVSSAGVFVCSFSWKCVGARARVCPVSI
jgi:hypothetical protein